MYKCTLIEKGNLKFFKYLKNTKIKKKERNKELVSKKQTKTIEML